MSKEEFLKIQTCVLKVNIHCDGCKNKVKKILQKIEGVYTTNIDAEQGKVTVSGNVDPSTVIKKLAKSGKHAEIWGSKPSNNQNQLNNQFKNMQIDNGKTTGKNGQKGGSGGPPAGAGNNNHFPKGGGQPNPQQMQQLQQLQQMKGFQDLKLPQFKDMKNPFKAPPNQNQNPQKAVKFNLPEDDDDMTDDEFDDDDDEFDDESEDDMDDLHHPLNNKMKPVMGKGPQGGPPNLMMMNGMNMMNPQMMTNAQPKNGGGPNGNKGGGNGNGAIPVQINGNGAKKGNNAPNGNNNGGNPNQGGGGGPGKSGGKGGGGDPKNGNNGRENSKNGNVGGGANGNGAKKGGVQAQPMNNLPPGFQNMGHQMGNMGMPPMGQMGMPRGGQMGHMPPVQGLPAGPPGAMNGGGDGGFHDPGPQMMGGNPYQQQLAAAMINQQRAMGNERFQPMMYARPPPAVNYMPPPYPNPNQYMYPYPSQHPHQPQGGPYTDMFSDENTSSCNVM